MMFAQAVEASRHLPSHQSGLGDSLSAFTPFPQPSPWEGMVTRFDRVKSHLKRFSSISHRCPLPQRTLCCAQKAHMLRRGSVAQSQGYLEDKGTTRHLLSCSKLGWPLCCWRFDFGLGLQVSNDTVSKAILLHVIACSYHRCSISLAVRWLQGLVCEHCGLSGPRPNR